MPIRTAAKSLLAAKQAKAVKTVKETKLPPLAKSQAQVAVKEAKWAPKETSAAPPAVDPLWKELMDRAPTNVAERNAEIAWTNARGSGSVRYVETPESLQLPPNNAADRTLRQVTKRGLIEEERASSQLETPQSISASEKAHGF